MAIYINTRIQEHPSYNQLHQPFYKDIFGLGL